ncbi:MAG: hypothetical protein OJF50_000945 [Nitrospira sp.]|nr:hypothetical protein [Nitrospira sp.]
MADWRIYTFGRLISIVKVIKEVARGVLRFRQKIL